MKEFALLLPEFYLVATVFGLVLGESAHHGERVRLVLPTALLGIAGAFIQSVLLYQNGPAQLFAGTVSIDGFSLFFKLTFLLLSAVTVSSACLGADVPRKVHAEFCAIALIGTVGLTMASSAQNLFVAIVGLQLAGACGYLMAGMSRNELAPAEAALKWLFCSAASGVFLLLGALALYRLTGTVNVYELHRLLDAASFRPSMALFVFAMVFMGLSIPLMAFPGNFVMPDVIQGANVSAGTFLVLGLRAGAIAVATRLWVVVFARPGAQPGKWVVNGGWDWTAWLAFSAGMSLLLPALLAMRQKSAKRTLACLAMVQTGFLLLGLLILEDIGLAAILFNVLVDLMAFGGLLFILSLVESRCGSDEIGAIRGSLRGRTLEAIAFMLFLVSWLGLPPFAGFVGKFALLGAAVRREWFVLALFGLLALALSLVAASRLMLGVLAPGAPRGPSPVEESSHSRAFLWSLLIPLAAASLAAEWLLRWAGQSLHFIFW